MKQRLLANSKWHSQILIFSLLRMNEAVPRFSGAPPPTLFLACQQGRECRGFFWNSILVLRLQLPGNWEFSSFLIQPLGAHCSWGHTQNQWFQGSPGSHSFGDYILETQARAQGYGKYPILWIMPSLPAPNTQRALGFLRGTLTEKKKKKLVSRRAHSLTTE